MAQLEDLNIGDAVSWSIPKPPQEPSTAHGIIKSLNREDETATIRVWAILELSLIHISEPTRPY